MLLVSITSLEIRSNPMWKTIYFGIKEDDQECTLGRVKDFGGVL